MRRTTKVLAAILILLLLVIALFIPLPFGISTYTPVSARPAGYLYIVTNRVTRPAPWFGKSKDHFVEGNKLYLNFQTTRSAVLLVTGVSPGISDVKGIQEFRLHHPELEHFWPDPLQADGGVAWTRERIVSNLEADIAGAGVHNPK